MANSQAKTSPQAKKILLAVSGGIAAYKAADLISLLTKRGHQVRCLMTKNAENFVTPLVIETLSGNPVYRSLFGPDVSGTEHINLARWADLMVFAPATANLIAKLALGLADDLVTTVALATEAPWVIAPAMNTVMWQKPVTRSHVSALRSRGVEFVEPVSDVLACGEEGPGKLAPVESIVENVERMVCAQDLSGLRVLITAGPTVSAIDPVRYITNHSTGKMGAALAEEALARGAEVYYILGVDKGVVRPQSLSPRLKITEVHTAEQMCQAALDVLPNVHGVITTAAVLDYQVAESACTKLKRSSEPVTLKLIPSVDVLATLRANAKPGQWFFGFAAETENLEENAYKKLEKKGLDYLFANLVAPPSAAIDTGFGTETNGGLLLRKGQTPVKFQPSSKRAIAHAIWDAVKI